MRAVQGDRHRERGVGQALHQPADDRMGLVSAAVGSVRKDQKEPLVRCDYFSGCLCHLLVTPFETRGDHLNNIKQEEMRVSSRALFDTSGAVDPRMVQLDRRGCLADLLGDFAARQRQ
jgi:hypothetical protein